MSCSVGIPRELKEPASPFAIMPLEWLPPGQPARCAARLAAQCHGRVHRRIEHVGFFRGLMDRLEDPADREAVLHCARRFYCLYGDVFRSLPTPESITQESAHG